MRWPIASRSLVLFAAMLAVSSLAAASTTSTPLPSWWHNPDDPDAFMRAATIMGAIGGGLKLLSQWQRNPGWQRLLGALGLGPFVGCVTALLAFGSYRDSPDHLMQLLAYCAAAGFCCDWVTLQFVGLVRRIFAAPPEGS